MIRSLSFAVLAALAAITLPQTAAAQCVGGGSAGAIPATGTGGGTFPTVLPTAPFVSTLAVSVPTGATVLKSLKVNGLTHTWGGDIQFVLENPAGAKFNIMCGFIDDNQTVLTGGNYEFVDPNAGGAFPFFVIGGTPAPGAYKQDFGTFPTGTNSISNTPIEQIPIASGNWKLYAYDWFAADVGSLSSWELCFGLPVPPPTGCLSGGAPATSFPAAGAVNGTFGTTLPTGELTSSATITIPAGSTISGVRLIGLSHAWFTDVMVVLQDPAGTNHLILQRDNAFACTGCGDAFNGDYTFTDDPSALPFPTCGSGALPSGTYVQDVGAWPNGGAGLQNTPVSSIPALSGTWTLKVYDACVGFDNGFLTAWELCVTSPSAPVAYCTAGTTTNGCTADISASANPSVTAANACNINVADVEGAKSGLIFYSVSGQAAAPWNGSSFLCVKAPTQRTPTQTSTGTVNTCAGTLSLDWNAYQAANPTAVGNPWTAGDTVQVQAWFRDPPAGKSTNLSNAIEMTYVP